MTIVFTPPHDWRATARERDKALTFFNQLSPTERFALQDAFVLGEGVFWADWGFASKPSNAFRAELSRLIQLWEEAC